MDKQLAARSTSNLIGLKIQKKLGKAFRMCHRNPSIKPQKPLNCVQKCIKDYGILESLMSKKIPAKVAISKKNISKFYMSHVLGEKNCLELVGRKNLFEPKKKFIRRMGILNEEIELPNINRNESYEGISNQGMPAYRSTKKRSHLNRLSIEIIELARTIT